MYEFMHVCKNVCISLHMYVIVHACMCVGEVGASWRGNQFSYKLSATIMPIYLFFSTTYLLIPAISMPKSRHHNILQVSKKRLSNFFKSQPTCPCARASWLPAWGKMVANRDYTQILFKMTSMNAG